MAPSVRGTTKSPASSGALGLQARFMGDVRFEDRADVTRMALLLLLGAGSATLLYQDGAAPEEWLQD